MPIPVTDSQYSMLHTGTITDTQYSILRAVTVKGTQEGMLHTDADTGCLPPSFCNPIYLFLDDKSPEIMN